MMGGRGGGVAGGGAPGDTPLSVERCSECHAVLEQYDEETVGIAIVCLETFIHREPALAAPLLLDMLQVVAR